MGLDRERRIAGVAALPAAACGHRDGGVAEQRAVAVRDEGHAGGGLAVLHRAVGPRGGRAVGTHDIQRVTRLTRDPTSGSAEERIVFWRSFEVALAGIRGAVLWGDFGVAGKALDFTPTEFNHPVYIMYSSGTTGVPKCIVHGAGGTVIQHLKEHMLHCDIGPDDRLFFLAHNAFLTLTEQTSD